MLIKLKQFCSNCKQYTYKFNVQKKKNKKRKKKQANKPKNSKIFFCRWIKMNTLEISPFQRTSNKKPLKQYKNTRRKVAEANICTLC